MTNKELENMIAEKFVSIMCKLRNIVMGTLMQNCSPYFKMLIMACLKMMDEEKINFQMAPDEQKATNDMFRYLDVPDRIRLLPENPNKGDFQRRIENTVEMLRTCRKDYWKLERIYNLLDKIDILLGAKDFYDKMQTIGELAQQLDNEYKDSKND